MFNINPPRVMSANEELEVAAKWNSSKEKEILDEKQKKLIDAIRMKAGSFSQFDYTSRERSDKSG